MTLRLQVDSCRPAELSALIKTLLGGTPVRCRNRQLWIQAVQDYFEDVPLCVPFRKLLQLVWETAPQVGCKVYLVKPDGGHQAGDLVALCRGFVPFPGCGVHVHIRTQNAVVSSSSFDDPQLVNIDCTGLGGHDLGGFKDYDICIRTDKHSQSIYGPSVIPLESPGRDGTDQVSLVALGGSKAMHEFLVLHYMATDSAEEWDFFLDNCLPRCTWVRAGSRRALALHMYNKCHVAPSHRRFAHGVEYPLNVVKLYWSRSGIMHVAIAWDHKPLLLLATALLPKRTTESFEMEAGPPYDKQRIQMGLRSGNTVLICFRSGVGHYQSVLIALAADLHTNKPWQGQHKFWKSVSPIRTYFAWLPEQLARTYCSAALDRRPDLSYGEVHHLQGSESDLRHSMVFQNIYHIGDTKSAQELEVFLGMSRERLRLCCGIQCTDSLHPNGPRQRQKLFSAALKLLWFAIGIETVRCENEAQRALHAALLPLLRLEDGHVLATLSAIVLALCEGRTGLAISGVFGAGKTRSPAALLAGLLVFDPSLQLMVLTKENIAAHAVAEHLVSLQMPDYLQDKMGRLVGYYEQNRKGSYTPLDILPSNRNQVIRQKSLLIGCGGGFQQECSQQFSPVADWMGSVDLFLEDEGQQYGNMEEAASVARTPATCLEVWTGDHRQTPGGLKKSKESEAFRKKLTKRPLALRCQTQYIQAHDLGDVALRYLDCPKDSFAWKLRQLLEEGSTAIDPAVAQFWHELIGDSPPCFSREIQRAAFAILWMGLRGEREGLPSMLATSFAEAAGVAGRQKWGLVLSSSARVSQVTYQTVVGVRYPELVTFNGTSWNFGKFVPHERPQRGGFLPIFWDVPRANTHAVEDIGERCEFRADAKSNLAVLRNRNDMTNLFRAPLSPEGSPLVPA